MRRITHRMARKLSSRRTAPEAMESGSVIVTEQIHGSRLTEVRLLLALRVGRPTGTGSLLIPVRMTLGRKATLTSMSLGPKVGNHTALLLELLKISFLVGREMVNGFTLVLCVAVQCKFGRSRPKAASQYR